MPLHDGFVLRNWTRLANNRFRHLCELNSTSTKHEIIITNQYSNLIRFGAMNMDAMSLIMTV